MWCLTGRHKIGNWWRVVSPRNIWSGFVMCWFRTGVILTSEEWFMFTDKHIMIFMALGLFVGLALNVWMFLASDDHSSNDFD